MRAQEGLPLDQLGDECVGINERRAGTYMSLAAQSAVRSGSTAVDIQLITDRTAAALEDEDRWPPLACHCMVLQLR